MANPETTSHLDDEKPQLKVERKEVKRKPDNIEGQNDKVKNIESENADLGLLFQTALLNLRESFPEIPEDLTNKKIRILKGKTHLNISKGMINIVHLDENNKSINLRLTESGNYQCIKAYQSKQPRYVNGKELYDYKNDRITSEEFEKEISEFINNSDSYKAIIR